MKGGEEKREPFLSLAQGSGGGFGEEGAPAQSPEGSEGAGDRMSKDRKERQYKKAHSHQHRDMLYHLSQ